MQVLSTRYNIKSKVEPQEETGLDLPSVANDEKHLIHTQFTNRKMRTILNHNNLLLITQHLKTPGHLNFENLEITKTRLRLKTEINLMLSLLFREAWKRSKTDRECSIMNFIATSHLKVCKSYRQLDERSQSMSSQDQGKIP